MGNKRRTVQALQVYKIDPERNLLFVAGNVPGKRGNYLEIKDSTKMWRLPEVMENLPFPTHSGELPEGEALMAPALDVDPQDWSLKTGREWL